MTSTANLPEEPTAAERVARILGIVGVVVSTLGLVAAQIRSGADFDQSVVTVLFGVWPYAPFFAAIASLAPARTSVARSVAMVLVSLLAMVVYADAALSERAASTNTILMFFMLPLYQMLGIAFANDVVTRSEWRAVE